MKLSPTDPLLVVEPILTLISWSLYLLFNQGSPSSPFRPLTQLSHLSPFKLCSKKIIIFRSRSPTFFFLWTSCAICLPNIFQSIEPNFPIFALPYFCLYTYCLLCRIRLSIRFVSSVNSNFMSLWFSCLFIITNVFLKMVTPFRLFTSFFSNDITFSNCSALHQKCFETSPFDTYIFNKTVTVSQYVSLYCYKYSERSHKNMR